VRRLEDLQLLRVLIQSTIDGSVPGGLPHLSVNDRAHAGVNNIDEIDDDDGTAGRGLQ